MTANRTPRPRIPAAAIAAAASRLAGTVVLFVEDSTVGPALYRPRLEAFASIENADQLLGDDDGTIIDLLDGRPARDLIDAHGTPGRAAAALTRELRAAGVL